MLGNERKKRKVGFRERSREKKGKKKNGHLLVSNAAGYHQKRRDCQGKHTANVEEEQKGKGSSILHGKGENLYVPWRGSPRLPPRKRNSGRGKGPPDRICGEGERGPKKASLYGKR